MENRIITVITAIKLYISLLEAYIPRIDPNHSNVSRIKQTDLEEAKKALEYYMKLFTHGDFKHSQTAQEIEGSCEGCMHIDCERDERPCSECCRLDRVDRYEQEDPTLADVFADYNMEV